MKASEQYLHVVLFIMLYRVVKFVLVCGAEILRCDHSSVCWGAVLNRPYSRYLTAVRTSGLVNPVFSCQTGFSSASICLLINRWLQLSPLYILSTGPLRLGSKVYPSNMQRMLHKGFTRFKQSLSRARQDRASKRKSLLAG